MMTGRRKGFGGGCGSSLLFTMHLIVVFVVFSMRLFVLYIDSIYVETYSNILIIASPIAHLSPILPNAPA